MMYPVYPLLRISMAQTSYQLMYLTLPGHPPSRHLQLNVSCIHKVAADAVAAAVATIATVATPDDTMSAGGDQGQTDKMQDELTNQVSNTFNGLVDSNSSKKLLL